MEFKVFQSSPLRDLKKSSYEIDEVKNQKLEYPTAKKAQNAMRLPASEVNVLSKLADYFSNLMEDVLSRKNGRTTQEDLKIKYGETKSFPKRLEGLVSAIHSYYMDNLKKIITPKKSITPQTNSTVSKDWMDCYESFCNDCGGRCMCAIMLGNCEDMECEDWHQDVCKNGF